MHQWSSPHKAHTYQRASNSLHLCCNNATGSHCNMSNRLRDVVHDENYVSGHSTKPLPRTEQPHPAKIWCLSNSEARACLDKHEHIEDHRPRPGYATSVGPPHTQDLVQKLGTIRTMLPKNVQHELTVRTSGRHAVVCQANICGQTSKTTSGQNHARSSTRNRTRWCWKHT